MNAQDAESQKESCVRRHYSPGPLGAKSSLTGRPMSQRNVGWVEPREAHAVCCLTDVNSTAGAVSLADSTHPTLKSTQNK